MPGTMPGFFMEFCWLMTPNTKKWLKRIAILLVLIYLLGGLLLYFFQEKFMFHPRAVSMDYQYKFEQPFEEVNASLDGENVNIIKFPSTVVKKGTVLFFHGNMINVEYYKKYPVFFISRGYELWMIDYPGFGKSTGKKNENNLYAQAAFFYSLLPGTPSDSNIIIYGKSIGTGIAAWLASEKSCRRLVLETPYYSMKKLAANFAPMYPTSFLSRYELPTYDYINRSTAPLTIFHGTSDNIVPYEHALQLKTSKPGLELVTIEGGEHNDLFEQPLYREKMDSLLRL